MQFLKVSCPQCAHYLECPQKTRMFVNYCGAGSKKIEESVREAVLDCRARQGRLLKRSSSAEQATHELPPCEVAVSP